MNFETAQTKQKRRSHSVPEPRNTLQFTPRDLQILEAVKRYRFLTSRHILQLISGSNPQLLKRVRDLMDAGYLMAIRNPELRIQNAGSTPKIYGLTREGAAVLTAEGLTPPDRVNWTRRNSDVNDPHSGQGIHVVPHTLLTADIMTEIEIFCRQSNGRVRFIDRAEILANSPETIRKAKHPLSWRAIMRYPRRLRRDDGEVDVSIDYRRVGVVPGWIFGLEFADKPAGRNRLFYMLEADRGRMVVVRSDFEQTSIFKKLLAYSASWAQEIPGERYGLKNFQVLIITKNRARIDTVVKAYQRLESQVMPLWERPCQPWVFQFAARDSVTPGRLLRYKWHNAHGNSHPLTGIPEDL